MMARTSSLLLILGLGLAPAAFAAPSAPAKPAPAAKKPPPPAPVKHVVVTPEHTKALLAKLGGFKFGMSKDEVVAQLSSGLDAKYEDQIKATSDVSAQDRLRAAKKKELAEMSSSYIAFDDKKTGWDVSIIEDEFAHNTNESMLERWENENGQNQRRFFFFYNGKLWKEFISLDVSILPADKKNFDTFRGTMEGAYGAGDVDVGSITWHTQAFDARAVDKLKTYDAIGIAIEDNSRKPEIMALRAEKAPPKEQESNMIKSIVDPNNSDHPDVKQNSNAVDAVIQANGGGAKPKK